MRVMYFPRFNFIILAIISLLSLTVYADEVDDAIKDLLAQSESYLSENTHQSATDFLKSQSQDNEDLDAQLKDIERDYIDKIDAQSVTQKDDALASNLANKAKKDQNSVIRHVDSIADEKSKSSTDTQQDVEDFLADTTPGSEDVDDLANSGRKIKEDEDLGFESQDMGEAVAQLSMLDGMKGNIEQGEEDKEGEESKKRAVFLFKGESLSCDRVCGKVGKDCCNLDGFFKNLLGGCPAEVKEVLAPAVMRDRRCHQVGNFYCVYRPLFVCLKERKTFCCYKSNLARIFQEIAHHQLDISWGTGRNPNCGPLDPKTFSKLDFDEPVAKKLLEDELMKDINNNAHKYIDNINSQAVKSDAEILKKIKALQARIRVYFKNQGGKQ